MWNRLTFFRTFSQVLQLLPSAFKRRFWGLIILIFFTGVVDLAGLASVVPIISIIADPDLLQNGSIWSNIQEWVGIQDYAGFVVAVFLFVFGLLTMRLFFMVFSSRVQAKFVYSLAQCIGSATYQSYLNSSYESFLKKESTQVIRELLVSPMHFAKYLVMPLLQVCSECIVLFMIIVGIAYVNIEVLVLLVVTVIPVTLIFQNAIKKKLRRLGKLEYEQSPLLHAKSVRGIGGFVDVKLRNKESVLLAEYNSVFAVLGKINTSITTYSSIPARLFELVTIGGLLLIVVYGFYIKREITMVLPLLTLYAAAGYRIMPSLVRIIPAMMQLEQYSYLFNVYRKVLKSPLEGREKEEKIDFRDELSIRGLSFTFEGAPNSIFDNIDVTIKKGEIVGVVGQSGSGKTTLVNMLTGFLKPNAGNIYVDGKIINDKNIRSYWSKISYVQQSSYIEKGSLASNIAFLDEQYDEKKLFKAIESASLADFVSGRSPASILIEEGGKNLSGGQKQRVIIARALYHDSEIIVMDEATSALDSQTEQAINDTIRNLRNTRLTIIIIAHRYSTLKYTDRIIRMKKGKIEEITTFEKLSV